MTWKWLAKSRLAAFPVVAVVGLFLIVVPLPPLDDQVSQFGYTRDVIAAGYPRAECEVTVDILSISSVQPTPPPPTPLTVGPDWSFYVKATIHGQQQSVRFPAAGVLAAPLPLNQPTPLKRFTFGGLKKGQTFNASIFGVAMEDDTAPKTGLPPLTKQGDLPNDKTWKQPGDDLGRNTWEPEAGQGGEGVKTGKLRCPGAGDSNTVTDSLEIEVSAAGPGEADENTAFEKIKIDFQIKLDP